MPDVLYRQDGSQIANHNKGEPEVETLFAAVKADFPWFDPEQHRAAADQYRHELLKEDVIRTCLMISVAEEALSERVMTAHRLFGMDSKTSMLYVTKLYQGEQPAWAVQGMTVLGVTEHHEEMARPINPAMLTFNEYFFVAPKDVLASLGVNTENTNHDTMYSALVSDGEIKSIRRYSNFVEGDTGVLANWQMMYTLHAKLARRMDLVRTLFSLPYLTEGN